MMNELLFISFEMF